MNQQELKKATNFPPHCPNHGYTRIQNLLYHPTIGPICDLCGSKVTLHD